MEFDPVNRDTPAPRYELESGSEDEYEHIVSERQVDTKAQESFKLVAANGQDGKLEQGSQLVVLVGSAGAAVLSSLEGEVPTQQYSLHCGSEQHAAIASSRQITVVLVAPSPQVRSSRFHDIARTLIEATKPSSVVVVDSYSPQDQLYRDTDSEDECGKETAIRYIATPSYTSKHPINAKELTPLRSPESASGIGAAFLSKAVIDNVPAILTLLEDVSFQSHIQLYGSLGASRLSRPVSETLSALTGLGGELSSKKLAAEAPRLVDFVATRRVKPAANLAVLGDGNMYI